MEYHLFLHVHNGFNKLGKHEFFTQKPTSHQTGLLIQVKLPISSTMFLDSSRLCIYDSLYKKIQPCLVGGKTAEKNIKKRKKPIPPCIVQRVDEERRFFCQKKSNNLKQRRKKNHS